MQIFKKKHCSLNNSQQDNNFQALKNSSLHGKINKGIFNRLASSYQVSIDVIYQIWRQAKETRDDTH